MPEGGNVWGSNRAIGLCIIQFASDRTFSGDKKMCENLKPKTHETKTYKLRSIKAIKRSLDCCIKRRSINLDL